LSKKIKLKNVTPPNDQNKRAYFICKIKKHSNVSTIKRKKINRRKKNMKTIEILTISIVKFTIIKLI
jgi:hypothetical protein